jgi:hypothetical protein
LSFLEISRLIYWRVLVLQDLPSERNASPAQ